MNPIITHAKVMQNFTICIAQPIREQLDLKQGDHVILSMNKKGEVKITKGVSSLEDFIGVGEKTFEALGGGEAYLKQERKNWRG
jgi:bifunctional DNA-binding transcriptional regulator/antitoxin component of YhaV-PrlF toxin-antitoxin module